MSDGSRNPDTPPSEAQTDWEALARYLTGESPPAEASAITRRLEARPADAALLAALDRAMRTVAHAAPADLDVEAALRVVKARAHDADAEPIGPRVVRPIVRPVSRWRVARSAVPALAAAAVLMIAIALWRAVGDDVVGTAPAVRAYTTAVGQRDSIRLTDGSLVVLAPLTRLDVSSGYGTTVREVTLSGEGYFDVVHDSTRPFIVRAGAAAIRDLGTAFTVRTGAGGVVVAVTAGSVLLRADSAPDDRGILLQAGDEGALRPNGSVVAERGVVTDEDVAWTRGRLVFRSAPLTEVADALRRWYGVELRFADTTLAGRHIDIDLTGEPVARALELIALTLGADLERQGDTAVIRSRVGAPAR